MTVHDAPIQCQLPVTHRGRTKKGWIECFRLLYKRINEIRPESVDKYSAIMFPTAYFIFNVG